MNILFTCAGRRSYLLKYFRENLGSNDRIIATDMQLTAPALQVADVGLQVPAVYDDDYVGIIIDICRKYRVDALISLNDLELPILADNKAGFEAIGVVPIVSDPEVVDICFDKFKTARWVESVGLKVPKTYVCPDDAKAALESGEISFPLFLKPRWGSGSIGLEEVGDTEELDICYKLLVKRIKKTILATASVGHEYVIIQEKLPGCEYGLDVMNDLAGNFVGVSVKKKLAMRAGETDKAVTVDLPEVRELGETIGRELGQTGILDVDIMQRSNGDYCVLEMNPRFGGGFPFSYEAGVNYPKAIIGWLNGKRIDRSMLQPTYGKTYAKNDCLVEVGKMDDRS